LIVYSIAKKESQSIGRESLDFTRICKAGAYETGDFPPIFTNKIDAEEFIKEHNFYNPVIVELELKQ
jgi:hypothetical protein